ncbi:MAG: nucleotide sugar dehydrogenase [Verrucomicrobiae bacterium]|nr:nucleotide sugar dehydrogenase [Verrucomicrobiae bacterium]MDW8307929.1 nucleotide sugar dehydrogenase [Verrucomicrobiales bacterium]
MKTRYDVAVVGGAGHVGVPLSLVMADRGLRTLIFDINTAAVETLRSGRLPFMEEGGEPLLRRALRRQMLGFSQDPAQLRGIPAVVVTIGTPIDEFLNPNFSLLTRCIDGLLPHLTASQTIILRSTVAPGATDFLERYLRRRGSKVGLAFCPERVVQGRGVIEIQEIPQLIAATSPRALRVARELFSKIAPRVIEMTPLEAEFAKLICNTFRYITFAATNQLYMMCSQAGIDYLRLLEKVREGYPRMAYIPGPGFAAGPCLMKDTMQLFAFGRHSFPLGQVAMTINEGLPNFVVEQLRRRMDLRNKRIGILGMAFKADSDDIRDSLSYKLAKILRFEGAEVLASDEYVRDPNFLPKEEVCRRAQVIIIGVPHKAYRTLKFPRGVEVVDLWGITRNTHPAPRRNSE